MSVHTRAMVRPVVGILANRSTAEDGTKNNVSDVRNAEVIASLADCAPMIIPINEEYTSAQELLDICDGLLLTGGWHNVHPSFYQETVTDAHGQFDVSRDKIALALASQAIQRGQPILGICRGFQEMNVALGGSLRPDVEAGGGLRHRMVSDASFEERFAPSHEVKFEQGGTFHKLFGEDRIWTNSLHGQGLARIAPEIVIDGRTTDGVPEAFYVSGAKGFALAVQWHPEANAEKDPFSRALFRAFGNAARSWASNPNRLSDFSTEKGDKTDESKGNFS